MNNYRLIRTGMHDVGVYQVKLNAAEEVVYRHPTPIMLEAETEDDLLEMLAQIHDEIHDKEVLEDDCPDDDWGVEEDDEIEDCCDRFNRRK